MPHDQTGVWQAVRRALGRLGSSVRVQEMPHARLTLMAPVAVPEILTRPVPSAGAAEAHWRPAACVAGLPRPQAQAGAGEAGLAPATVVAGLDAVLRPERIPIQAAPLLSRSGAVHRLDDFGVRAVAVRSAPAALPAGAVLSPVVRLTAPGTERLPTDAPGLPREPRLRRPGLRPAPGDPLRIIGGRIRPGASVIAEVPMTRARKPAPPGAGAEAFASERRQLAQTARVAEGDVVLLGVFPLVPVAAVRRLALEEGGALSLWLKPDAPAAAHAVGQKAPRLVTLIVGRQHSTGKMIQTVA
ncbi:MAG: hypothetical protein JO250_18110 [Armatimonadetes bacterium]|nr:hypothetical protein [Armatimonadota bacterium]